MEEEHSKALQHAEERTNKKLETIKKAIREAETYRDTLLQKMHHLAEDLLTRTQMIQPSSQDSVVTKTSEESFVPLFRKTPPAEGHLQEFL